MAWNTSARAWPARPRSRSSSALPGDRTLVIGDGVLEETMPATVIFEGEAAEDDRPPDITIETVEGKVTVVWSAADGGAGMLTGIGELDADTPQAQRVANGSTLYLPPGEHTLTVVAEDRLGNVQVEGSRFEVRGPCELRALTAFLEEVWEDGLITVPGTYHELRSRLEDAQRRLERLAHAQEKEGIDPGYVACLEDVLDLYEQPYDPKRPVVCFDEVPRQLIAETRRPLPARPGKPQRYDYEYRRNGVCSLLMFFEPKVGRREVLVRERRTRQDFAYAMKYLVNVACPEAEIIHVVQDQLNTHAYASLYATFPSEEANRLHKKLVFHYTLRHSRGRVDHLQACLSVSAPAGPQDPGAGGPGPTRDRNQHQATVNWQFRT